MPEKAPRARTVVSEIPAGARLTRSDYALDPSTLAKALLGRRLVRVLDDGTRLSGLIVETEAYLGAQDRAAHTYNGRRTPRNEAMYARPGIAYVYFTYGMHHCLNVVCGHEDEPVAVLLRALEPVEGLDFMRLARQGNGLAAPRDTDLCSGPGKICQAMSITRTLNGLDLAQDSHLFVETTASFPPASIGNSARIGVGAAGEWVAAPLRWFLKNNPHVSMRLKNPKPPAERKDISDD